MRVNRNVVIQMSAIMLAALPGLLEAGEIKTALEELFSKKAAERVEGKSGKPGELLARTNEVIAMFDANMSETGKYLLDKRQVGDDWDGVPLYGYLLARYCEKLSDGQLAEFLTKLLDRQDYGKRCFFMSYFWEPMGPDGRAQPDAQGRRIAEFCMRYLDQRQAADEIAWPLFSYLDSGRPFYINDEHGARQTAWVRRHALRSKGMYGYMANEIMMSQFPWNRELRKRFQDGVEQGADPFVLAGMIGGLSSRLGTCARYVNPGDKQYAIKKGHYRHDKLIPSNDIHILAVTASNNLQRIATTKYPLGTLRPDVRHPLVPLLFYLGALDYDSPAGKKVMAFFVEKAPLESVIEHFGYAAKSSDGFWQTMFPVLAKEHGNRIFAHIKREHEKEPHNDYCLGTGMQLIHFAAEYFACPAVPEKDKQTNRGIWKQLTEREDEMDKK